MGNILSVKIVPIVIIVEVVIILRGIYSLQKQLEQL
jgi:hypothetical protein